MCPLLISDVDECQETPHICGAHSTCNNTDGGYTCECEAGFEKVGVSCLGKYITVTELVGGYEAGFEMVGGSCLGEYNTVTELVGGCEAGFEMVGGSFLGEYNTVTELVGGCEAGFEMVA